MSLARTLVASVAVALVAGSATLLTTSCRTQPPTPASGRDEPRSARSRAPRPPARDLEQLRRLSQLKPTIDLFVRGLNRGDAAEISAAFLEIGTLEPERGRPLRGRSAIRRYYERSANRPGGALAVRIDEAVIGSDRASVRTTLMPRSEDEPHRRVSFDPRSFARCGRDAEPLRATFVLRRSAPTDWHIERATLVPIDTGGDGDGKDRDDHGGRRERA